MVNRGIRILTAALLMLTGIFLVPQASYGASASDVRMEQVSVCMPQVKVYLMGEDVQDVDFQQITAQKEDEELSVESIGDFNDSGEGILYMCLLDISGSIDGESFQGAKDALLDFAGQLKDTEKCMLLTFGNDVKTVWVGSESQEERKKLLDGIQNDNENTQLFEALHQAADLSVENKGSIDRKVALVFTDGLDEAVGKSTSQEALNELQAKGLPVYGIAVGKEKKTEAVNSFGEFVRSSGGALTVPESTAVSQDLIQLKEQLYQARVLGMKGSSNLVSKEVETVKLTFQQYPKTESLKTEVTEYEKDTEAPQIEDVVQLSDNQIQVIFTEAMNGIDEAENFQLIDKKEKSLVPEASSVEERRIATLTFKDNFYRGDYTLEFKNITDYSMEKNPLEDTADLTLEGDLNLKIVSFLKSWGWLLAIVLVAAAAATAIIIYRKIKKNKGLVVIDDKLTLQDQVQVEKRQKVEFKDVPGAALQIQLRSGTSAGAVIERFLSDSLIVGRSSQLCGLCIQDSRMSKQHFVLEFEKGRIFITDLESTNGTMVNGVRLLGRQPLNPGDLVCAGNMEMVIQWQEKNG